MGHLLLAVSAFMLASAVVGQGQPGVLSLSRSYLSTWHEDRRQGEDPEVSMNANQLITSKGFPCENYWVTTDDGYILNILRIPHGRSNRYMAGPRPVALLQHGMMTSCTNFLTNPVNESLAYILADAGVDVWLGNSRGNIYSTNHTYLDPRHREFWEFSADEMASYDLPAVIDFILTTTGVDQLYYIGHSQGTTIGFAAFSYNQNLASRIKMFIAMAPVAQVWNTKSPIRFLDPLSKEIDLFFNTFGHGELNIPPYLLKWLAEHVCEGWGEILCENALFLFCGFDPHSFNQTRVDVYVSHNPAGSSVRDLLWWAQQIHYKRFQRFDYGSAIENLRHYGQIRPPIYDISKMKVHVTVFSGGNDWLSDPIDVKWLIPQINVTHNHYIPQYNHLDFVWATDARYFIYDWIVKYIYS